MKLLLDTHAALWWLSDDTRLGDTSAQLMTDASNQVLLSAVYVTGHRPKTHGSAPIVS